jgi:hypothetical protein
MYILHCNTGLCLIIFCEFWNTNFNGKKYNTGGGGAILSEIQYVKIKVQQLNTVTTHLIYSAKVKPKHKLPIQFAWMLYN